MTRTRVNELPHIELPTLQQIYANAGYRLLEVDPRSIVAVEWPGVPDVDATDWAKRIDELVREYAMLKRGATIDEMTRAGFKNWGPGIGCVQAMRDDPPSRLWAPHGLAELPGTNKYLMIDPYTPHHVLGDLAANRKCISIIFDGSKPFREFTWELQWRRHANFLEDAHVDDSTKTRMAKQLIEDFREQYRKGRIDLDFGTLEERL